MGQYGVVIKKSAAKRIKCCPKPIIEKFFRLIADLEEQGPMPKGWQGLSKLTGDNYHCHLAYHYVACWRYENGSFLIEVYYAGSREDAPY